MLQSPPFARPPSTRNQHAIARRLMGSGLAEVLTTGFSHRDDGTCCYCMNAIPLDSPMVKIASAQSGRQHWVHPYCAAADLRLRGLIDEPTYQSVLCCDPADEQRSLGTPRSAARPDEQTGIILAIDQGPPGVHKVRAGAGSGKTTMIGRICARSFPIPLGVSSATNAAVRTVENTPGVPRGGAFTAHSMGLRALALQVRMQDHNTAPGCEARIPKFHASKVEIMLQTLCPPDPRRPYDGSVSLMYKVNSGAVKMLYDRALLYGFGIAGHPENSDHLALLRICKRHSIVKILEAAHDLLPEEDKAAYAELMASEQATARRDEGFERRLFTMLRLTTLMLDEGLKVSTQQTWEGKSQIANALNPDDVMVLPAVSFPCMLSHPVRIKAPILLKCGRKALRLLVDEAQDLSIAAVELLLRLLDPDEGKLVVFCNEAQREFAFAAAHPVCGHL